MKICKICNATEDLIGFKKDRIICNNCLKKNKQEYYFSNLERIKGKRDQYREANREKINTQKRKHYQLNKERLIKNASDATIIVPLIKEYLDVAVKNDDHLVKLTAIVQRYISTKQTISGADGLLSDSEKQQLLAVAEQTLSAELDEELSKIDIESDELTNKFTNLKIKIDKQTNE